MYVKVSIPISSFKTFIYSIKNFKKSKLFVGQSITVKFRNKLVNGFIVSITNKIKFKGKILEINSINLNSFKINAELWKTLNWVSKYYICSIGKVLHTSISYQHKKTYNYPTKKILQITKEGKKALKNNLIKYQNQKEILNYINQKFQVEINQFINLNIISYKSTCKRLESLNYIKIIEKNNISGILQNHNIKNNISKKINLTKEQSIIYNLILNKWENDCQKPTMISGVSGSGKTLVYIKLIQKTIKQEKSVIVLVPEISLISHIYFAINTYIPNQAGVWHSRLNQSEKNFILFQSKINKITILVSTRSGLFFPFNNLGLLIIDEEQESSYKQAAAPNYHARDVALIRSKFSKSKMVLVSSSPSIESYYNYKNNKFSFYELKERYKKYKLPKIKLINMKNKENYIWGHGLISKELFKKINESLDNKNQILLLYNRIGDKIKKLEITLKKIFPNKIILRYDRESINKKDNYYKLLDSFHNNKVHILLGTQMIAKGIDFKNVAVVGIINADFGLNLPDFRADEKFFQLIYQTIGRAGRNNNHSFAIIQTFDFENKYIQSAYKFNLVECYNNILAERKKLFYPPFSKLIRIIISGKNLNLVKSKSKLLANKFINNNNIILLGPSMAPIEKINNAWRMHILLKAEKKYWIKLFDWIDKNIGLQIFENKTSNLKIKIDVDPISFL